MSSVPTFQTTPLNRARNAREARYPGLWEGLLGTWQPGLGPTGLTLHDLSGRGNDGALTNMPPATAWTLDDGRWALEFDEDSSDFVDLGLPPNLDLPGNMTVAFWMQSDGDFTSVQYPFANFESGSNSGRWLVNFGNVDNKIQFQQNSNRPFSSNATITDTEWHFVICTRQGITGDWDLTVTIDDETTVFLDVGFDPGDYEGGISIGRAGTNDGLYFGGLLEDLHLHDVAFAEPERLLLFQLGRGGWMAKRRRVLAKAPAAPPAGGILVHPGMTGGIPVMAGGMRG